MYVKMNKWDEAVDAAASRGAPQLESLKQERMAWLLATGQEERAGAIREARTNPRENPDKTGP